MLKTQKKEQRYYDYSIYDNDMLQKTKTLKV
jgi:hypothetical protein